MPEEVGNQMITIGVLSLQGSVIEHVRCINRLPDVQCIEVKTLDALQKVDGLILPGGESTTMGKLLHFFNLMEPLKKRILEGMPIWGTCAGMILLANNLVDEPAHLGVMDITVRRNAYGRQTASTLKYPSRKSARKRFHWYLSVHHGLKKQELTLKSFANSMVILLPQGKAICSPPLFILNYPTT